MNRFCQRAIALCLSVAAVAAMATPCRAGLLGEFLDDVHFRCEECLNQLAMSHETGASMAIEVLDPDCDNPVKDVLIKVEETRRGSLMIGLGVNSDAGLTGSVILQERAQPEQVPPPR